MKDLTMFDNEALSREVFKDSYFFNEVDNKDYVIALVKEEFFYTEKQMDTLKANLVLSGEYIPN